MQDRNNLNSNDLFGISLKLFELLISLNEQIYPQNSQIESSFLSRDLSNHLSKEMYDK